MASSPQPKLTAADDRLHLSEWLPPQWGVAPCFRLGRHWINLLWLAVAGYGCLLLAVPVAQGLRAQPGVAAFLARYPGLTALPVVYRGFPAWLAWQHFFNLLFLVFIIRAGLQILADHPRLYWNRDCTPGSEWFRFQRPVPSGRIWTAKDDSVTLPGWLGLPGLRHSIGLARWWHFGCDFLWLLNGVVFYVLLFATGQWQRLVPRTWAVFPNAASAALQYLSLRFPPEIGWVRYNSLQQLTYFGIVFVAAPLAIVTGLLQAPAVGNHLGWLGRSFHRQAARSVHFLLLAVFVLFIFGHVTMVFLTGARANFNHIFAARDGTGWAGVILGGVALLVVAAAWAAATPATLRWPRSVQRTGRWLIGWLKGASEWFDPATEYAPRDISPHFWPNGTLPRSPAFEQLVRRDFADYHLRIFGLVERPLELSMAELRAMAKQEQITEHFCIQGWSGVARWGGVPVRDVMALARPLPQARFGVFYSLAEGSAGGTYYDVHNIENLGHRLTILAYEMNGAPLSVLHGAPLRLRCENELGFKQVKWVAGLEFVATFGQLGAGQGGYNEDHEFYGYRMPI